MSSYRRTGLPPLDCHAHISPDVTEGQISALGDVLIFAMTRSMEEAEKVRRRSDRVLMWGCGVHPGNREAVHAFEPQRFEALLADFVLVGELGLDRRSGNLSGQLKIFREMMSVSACHSVLRSVHSTGCVELVLDVIDEYRPRGCILHWFNASKDLVDRAVNLGCYFSVNVAMADDAISKIPLDRLLPETDFPATRRHGVHLPAQVDALEGQVSTLHGLSPDEVRIQWYRNLRRLVTDAGLFERVPDDVADLLLGV